MSSPSAGQLSGTTFEQYLVRKGGSIAPEWALQILRPVIQAVSAVHHAGTIHGAVSPQQILLTNTGQVQLMGGSGAREAADRYDPYAAPERCGTGGAAGPWSDVYSVAATLYRAVTGQAPPPAVARASGMPITRPSTLGVSLPPYLEAALLKAMAMAPDARFLSVAELDAALRGSSATTVPSPPAMAVPPLPPPPPPVTKPAETRPIAVPADLPFLPRSGDAVAIGPAARPRQSGLPGWAIGLIVLALAGGAWRLNQGRSGAAGEGPTIQSFAAEKSRIQPGETTVLSWSVAAPAKVNLLPGNQVFGENGSVTVQPAQTTTYRLIASNQYGATRREVTVEVAGAGGSSREFEAPPPPTLREHAEIVGFEAEPSTVTPDEPVVLRWSVRNAKTASISPEIGPVNPQGGVRFKLRRSVTFTLSARGADGQEEQRTVRVDVAQGRMGTRY